MSAGSSVLARSSCPGFDDLRFEGVILPELERLNFLDVIRLVDMVIVAMSESGELVRL